jgi:hypothetical protein
VQADCIVLSSRQGAKTAKGERFDEGFRADIIVAGAVIVELQSTETNHTIHAKQLRTYLKLTGLRLGLVVNFGLDLIKDGIIRVVNGLPEEGPCREKQGPFLCGFAVCPLNLGSTWKPLLKPRNTLKTRNSRRLEPNNSSPSR